MEQLLPFFVEFGMPGMVIAFLTWMIIKKEDRINDLTDQLVSKSESDIQRYTEITLTMERILIAVKGE